MTMRILVPVDGSASSRAAVRFLAGRETMLGQNPETPRAFRRRRSSAAASPAR